MENKSPKSGFSGSIGFVLAAAGSAVGLGNIWRFPYLAAKDGGGLFLVVYLLLVLTFGNTLLTTDIAVGRRTGKSSVKAYGDMKKGWGFLGYLTFFVPLLIMTYYAVIGGWVLKYIVAYITGQWEAAATDTYFTGFITQEAAPIIFMLVFLAVTVFVVYNGVEKGIERFSKFVMPALLVIVVGIVIYSLTLSHEGADGVTRTGLQGLKVYLIPDFTGMTAGKFLNVLLDAMSQLFFSLSVSMGIMITYGSYVKKEVNLNKSVAQIEVFDTGVAFLAGMMIIPSIFAFTGTSGAGAGPGLIFVSLPKVFAQMGPVAGTIIGLLFFVMVAFAALTSCVSVLETLVDNFMEIRGSKRQPTTLVLGVIYAIADIAICLGYNVLYGEWTLPNGGTAQLLDIADYISNSFLMPLVSLLSTILIGWIVTPKWVTDEIETGGVVFGRKKLYNIMIKFVCPIMMLILFLQSTGLLSLFIK